MAKPAIQQKFLKALRETGSVGKAGKIAGIGHTSLYRWRQEDEVFAAKWDLAAELTADGLEDECRRRAMAGSDNLLMFLLKGLRPERWRESRASMSPAELNKLIEGELKRLAKEKETEDSAPVN